MIDAANAAYENKITEFGDLAKMAEERVMLRAIDNHWQRHLTDLDVLREGIGLVSIVQRDPLVEYKREAFVMFNEMRTEIRRQAVQDIFRTQINIVQRQPAQRRMQATRPGAVQDTKPEPARANNKLGRNDPCW